MRFTHKHTNFPVGCVVFVCKASKHGTHPTTSTRPTPRPPTATSRMRRSGLAKTENGDASKDAIKSSTELPDYFMRLSDDPSHCLPLKYATCLIISSFAFLVPAWLAFSRSMFLHTAMYSLTFLASVNYWRKACHGIRRDFDMLVAKLSFVFSLISGLSRIHEARVLYVGWALVFLLLGSYGMSIYLHSLKQPAWILAHGSMHVFISVGMSIVVLGELPF